MLVSLKCYCAWAHEQGLVVIDPGKPVKLVPRVPQTPRQLSDREEAALGAASSCSGTACAASAPWTALGWRSCEARREPRRKDSRMRLFHHTTTARAHLGRRLSGLVLGLALLGAPVGAQAAGVPARSVPRSRS